MGLSDADYLAVLRGIHNVAEVLDRHQFGPVALTAVNSLVRSDVTSLNEVDPVARRLTYLAIPDSFVVPANVAEVLTELASEHPLIGHHARSGDGSPIKISDFQDHDTWHASAIYQRLYGPMGIEHQMSITLPAPAPIVIGIAVNRTHGDFDDRDRAVLNLLRPHLSQSWRRARDYERLRVLTGAAAGVLAQAGTGVILLSNPIQELTSGALIALFRFFGRPAPHDELPSRVRRWVEHQQMLHSAAVVSLELSRPLQTTLEQRHLVLRYLPGVGDGDDMILLDERKPEAAARTLRALGLTERESTVARLLASGATNIQIAEQLSVSAWTIKRHLANIYSKLGVRSRAAAAAIAVEIETHHSNDDLVPAASVGPATLAGRGDRALDAPSVAE